MSEIKLAIRQLLKKPVFTLVALLTIAIGIGANTAIFTVIRAVLLQPLPYANPERLVMLWERNPAENAERDLVTPMNFVDWREQSTSFEQLAFFFTAAEQNVIGPAGVERISGASVSSALFPVLGVQPFLGRTFTSEEDNLGEEGGVVVLSHALWQRRYGGDPNVLGQTLAIDSYGRRNHRIIGVMPLGFEFPRYAEYWLPTWHNPGTGNHPAASNRRSAHWLQVLGRLKLGVSADAAQAEMNTIQQRIKQQNPGANIGSHVKVAPLHQDLIGNTRTALLMLWGVVGFLLLIACANVANMLLARAAAREREMAVRSALGASRWQIVKQLLLESICLALLGGLIGVLLASAGTNLLITLLPPEIAHSHPVNLNSAVLVFGILLSTVTGIVFGLAPALKSGANDLNTVLKGGAHGSVSTGTRARLRDALVISEIALALVLLAGAGLLLVSVHRLQRIDLGFRPEQIVAVGFDFSGTAFRTNADRVVFRELTRQIAARPDVNSVGGATFLPLGELRQQGLIIDGRPLPTPENAISASTHACTPEFFRTLGIPLLRGRSFTEQDGPNAPRVVIVNQRFAELYFPGEDPVGKRLSLDSRDRDRGEWRPVWWEIVGVAGNVKLAGFAPEAIPMMYASYWQWPWHQPQMVIRTGANPATVAEEIRREIQRLHPNVPITRTRLLTTLLADQIAAPRSRAFLLALFSALAVTLAGVGVYGVIAYSVSQRTREIGLRMAIGAQKSDVVAMILRQGLVLVVSGVALGLLGALGLSRFMASQLFAVKPTDPAILLSVSLLLISIALLACFLPARRAARIDPMEALRYE